MLERWLSLLNAKDARAYWVTYAAAFVVMFMAMAGYFFLKGHDFIWVDDGLTQQYTAFVEAGTWIRQLLANIFVSHTFEVPMWSPELGYGQDYILWVSSALSNPINWIAVFATAENAQALLNLTVPVTLFLAGIAYARLCFYHGCDGFATLIGCMTFLFSGTTVIAFTQIFMVYPLLLVPLVVLGVDKVLDGASPVLFVLACALTALYSLTTIWMMCLLLLVYCVVRYAFMADKGLKRFCILFVRVFLWLVLGVAIGAVLFVPSAVAILSLDRVGLARPWNLFYALDYYIEIGAGSLKFAYAGSECFIGMLSLSAVAVVGLLASKKDARGKMLAILFVIFTIILLLPALGRVMNGFAYPNNRWVWAFALLVGCITTYMVPRFLESTDADKRRLVVAMTVALVFFMAFGIFARKSFYVVLMLFVVTACCLYVLKGRAMQLSMALSVLLSCALLFTLWGRDMASRNVPLGQAYSLATDGVNELAASIPGDDWRYDVIGNTSNWRNSSTVVDKNSTTFYNSVYNGAIDDFHTQLGLTTSALNFSVNSLDGRAIIQQFAGVKYVIAPAAQHELISGLYESEPSYQGQDADAVELGAYDSSVQLPLAFLQDKTMAESTFRSLGPVEAQEALLEYAVLEDGAEDAVLTDPCGHRLGFSYELETWEEPQPTDDSAQEPNTESVMVSSIEGAAADGCERDVHVDTKGSATMHLDVDLPADQEIYVVMEDIGFEPSRTLTSSSTTLQKLALKLEGIFPLTDNGCSIAVTTEDRGDGVWQSGRDAHLYSGKDTWAFCLGSASYERSGIDIALQSAGAYDIGSIAVYAEDEALVEARIAELSQQGAQDIMLSGNEMSCHVDAADPEETLVIRLPYSSGWSAWVDGQKTEVLNADLGFMGLALEEGAHDIVLRYETPGLTAGALISAGGIVVLVASVIMRRRMADDRKKDARR